MQSTKEISLKHYLGDDANTPEGKDFMSHQKSLVLVNSKLYLNCRLKGEAEMTTVFVIPKAHGRKAIDGCHWDADIRVRIELHPSYWEDSGGPVWW